MEKNYTEEQIKKYSTKRLVSLFYKIHISCKHESKNSQLEIILSRLKKRKYDRLVEASRPIYRELHNLSEILKNANEITRGEVLYEETLKGVYGELLKLID